IYRDIADLIGSGVPIDGEAGVGYLMRSGYDLPPLMFSHDEIVALVAGARMVRAWGGAAMARGAEEALVKIDAVLPDNARDRASSVQIYAMSAHSMSDDLRARIDVLEAAVDTRERLRFDYADINGAATNRTVRPLGLWFWGKVWTLVAWCELRNDFRIFRLDRIGATTASGQFRAERDKSLTVFFSSKAYKRDHR
ncbi:MAG: helix-turn-helix transcriptional regulator, partial [Paracoccaceae bacterium]